MIWVLRVLGLWLLRRVGAPIVEDLRAGDRRGAGRRVRRAAQVAVFTGGALLLGWILLAVLLMLLLIRAVM